ncbi:hypothetical protein CAEBREN_04991 [Caenorhabditis brenneri]|uniref:Uncharacterized protein n=1 Tax=Caenorhabditis brenneri TaxID=135651 RepID=G0MJ54_CAEBE|nr:hypothetical protein CAEBREN_04991 [Caenorhabditis brenneri]
MTRSKRGIVDSINARIDMAMEATTNTDNSDGIYKYFKTWCATKPGDDWKMKYTLQDSCKKGATYTLELCEKRKTSGCKKIVYDGVAKYCEENKSASVCDQWLTTTSSGPNLLPFIIGGAVGMIVLLAVAIGVFCYCRRKKKMGKNQTMTGTTTGGTSGTGTGTATVTTNKTGTTQATGTNTCAKY